MQPYPFHALFGASCLSEGVLNKALNEQNAPNKKHVFFNINLKAYVLSLMQTVPRVASRRHHLTSQRLSCKML